jgi:hypothetical protein
MSLLVPKSFLRLLSLWAYLVAANSKTEFASVFQCYFLGLCILHIWKVALIFQPFTWRTVSLSASAIRKLGIDDVQYIHRTITTSLFCKLSA